MSSKKNPDCKNCKGLMVDISYLLESLHEFYNRDALSFDCSEKAPFSRQCNQYMDTGSCRHTRAKQLLNDMRAL